MHIVHVTSRLVQHSHSTPFFSLTTQNLQTKTHDALHLKSSFAPFYIIYEPVIGKVWNRYRIHRHSCLGVLN